LKAGYGQNGPDGQDAAPPTEGSSGRDIEIQLSFDPDRPGYIEVLSGEHDEFELSSSELLFLDTHGGNGGNGGCGEVFGFSLLPNSSS
jgi:hypothetical protein